AAYIITDSDDNQITGFHLGAMRSGGLRPAAAVIRRTALACVSPGNLADMLELPAVYRRARVPYLFDPGQQLTSLTGAQLRSAVTGSAGFVANDYEVALALKKMGWTMRQLLGKTGLVVTTLGPKGSKIQQGSTTVIAPPAKPKSALDPTGAGDAYRAGLICGLLQRWPLPVVARFAGLVAVYTVEAYGTQTHRFTWVQLQRRYRKDFGAALPPRTGHR
ncbi:MAG: PfkB family carbohydrate kinase, partial [Patescibacteria group bacterium]|nr:PfkB family carbohydrate kinase [Patescibacteria group bacterium]